MTSLYFEPSLSNASLSDNITFLNIPAAVNIELKLNNKLNRF